MTSILNLIYFSARFFDVYENAEKVQFILQIYSKT